jgi:hypothetical protein
LLACKRKLGNCPKVYDKKSEVIDLLTEVTEVTETKEVTELTETTEVPVYAGKVEAWTAWQRGRMEPCEARSHFRKIMHQRIKVNVNACFSL